MQEVTGSSPVPSTTSPQTKRSGDFFRGGRYRTRTAAEATAACGGNREPRLGQRSDFSKLCQGAAEKSANATRTGASRQIPSRFPTRRNVYRDDRRFVVGGTELEQQRRRPPPAAETGSRGWDSVLIFQSSAKGLRKNQQTQPVQVPAVRFRQGSQRLGMSTGMTAVLWWAVQDENRNEQRQGITMVVVSCLLLFLIEYGILGSVQQICIWRIESCGMN